MLLLLLENSAVAVADDHDKQEAMILEALFYCAEPSSPLRPALFFAPLLAVITNELRRDYLLLKHSNFQLRMIYFIPRSLLDRQSFL